MIEIVNRKRMEGADGERGGEAGLKSQIENAQAEGMARRGEEMED